MYFFKGCLSSTQQRELPSRRSVNCFSAAQLFQPRSLLLLHHFPRLLSARWTTTGTQPSTPGTIALLCHQWHHYQVPCTPRLHSSRPSRPEAPIRIMTRCSLPARRHHQLPLLLRISTSRLRFTNFRAEFHNQHTFLLHLRQIRGFSLLFRRPTLSSMCPSSHP